jgi:hypothetical protein
MILEEIYELVDDENIQFNVSRMSKKQRDLFNNYKKDLVKESIEIDNHRVKFDDNLLTQLNHENKLSIKNLNSKQKYLLDCCINELDNCKELSASELSSNRSKNKNASKIIKKHLNEIKNILTKKQLIDFKKFCNENSLNLTEKYLHINNDNNNNNDKEEIKEGTSSIPQYLTEINFHSNQTTIFTPVFIVPTIPITNDFLILDSILNNNLNK